MKNAPKDRRGGGFRALAASLDKLTKPIFGKRGLADGAIATAWPRIVGDALADVTLPEKISYPRGDRRGGTLYLKVAGGSFATELIHLEPQLIERINGYFGYRAVDRVRITQGPLPRPEKTAEKTLEKTPEKTGEEAGAKPAAAGAPGGDARLDGVDDPALAEALKSLGRAVAERQGNRHKTDTKL